jgi:hypothetical protein
MTIAKLAETCETKMWLFLIPILDEEGLLMQVFNFTKRLTRTKIGFLCLLFLIWAAVGFIFGLVLGRMIWIIQAL